MTGAPEAGQIVRVRQRQYFVEEVVPPAAAPGRTWMPRLRKRCSHQVSARYRDGLRAQFTKVCARHGVAFGRYYETADDPEGETVPRNESSPAPATPLPPLQTLLALNE